MGQEVDLRASSVSTLFDCAARWAAIHIDGEDMPSSGAAWLGTSVHHATALFDQAEIDGKPMTVTDAADALVETLWHPTEEVRWTDMTQKDAERAGLLLNREYCVEIAPHQDYVLVERKLSDLEIDLGDGIRVLLTGTLDRVREVAITEMRDGELWTDDVLAVADVKTGKTAVTADGNANTIAHVPQLGVYTLLAEIELNQELRGPPAIIGLRTSSSPAAAITAVPNAKERLIDLYLPAAKAIFQSGIFQGNPRSQLCSERYCPIFNRCQWRG